MISTVSGSMGVLMGAFFLVKPHPFKETGSPTMAPFHLINKARKSNHGCPA